VKELKLLITLNSPVYRTEREEMIVGLIVVIVVVGALTVCFVGYRRLKVSRESPATMDSIAPYVPEGGFKFSKTKSRAQAIQEHRSQIFRERARFAASTAESSVKLRGVDEGKELGNSIRTDLESQQQLKGSITVENSSMSECNTTPRSVQSSAVLYRALVQDTDKGSSPRGFCSNENSGSYQSKSGLVGSNCSWKGNSSAYSQTGPSNYSGGGRGVPQRSTSIIVAEVTV
jgi:hypothetical protein